MSRPRPWRARQNGVRVGADAQACAVPAATATRNSPSRNAQRAIRSGWASWRRRRRATPAGRGRASGDRDRAPLGGGLGGVDGARAGPPGRAASRSGSAGVPAVGRRSLDGLRAKRSGGARAVGEAASASALGLGGMLGLGASRPRGARRPRSCAPTGVGPLPCSSDCHPPAERGHRLNASALSLRLRG